VGVEEELLLVDEQTLEPVAAAATVVERAGDGVKHELMATFVETATGICGSPQEAYDEVRTLRRRVVDAAAPDALRALAIGSHPFASPDDAPIVDNPDYLEFTEAAGPAARRQGVCGLHVHVGMPDPETCVRAHEGVLPWLPLVLALAANSPWFRGEVTGLLSKRAEVLATLPRSGVPPSFGSWDGWVATMERWIRAGVLKKPTQTWWDVRIHPALGTLEIRAPDQPTDVERTGAFIALLHALAVWAAGGDGRPASRADAHTNRFFASRFGPGARLIHPDEDRLVPVPELYAELRERLAPYADERLLAALDPAHSEAERQLAAGDPRAACADAVERSLASPA
jgi:glutamate---cysteine ligase / carboxylate-amine ligase